MAIAPPACRPIEATAERGLTLAHDFAVPARLVYQAFTRPELVRRWWGASSMTTVCQADVGEGGCFVYTTRTFNGGAVRVTGTYRLVAPAERLVFTIADDLDVGSALATVTFFEHEGSTQLISTFRYSSQATRDGALASGIEGRWNDRFERLASLLTALL